RCGRPAHRTRMDCRAGGPAQGLAADGQHVERGGAGPGNGRLEEPRDTPSALAGLPGGPEASIGAISRHSGLAGQDRLRRAPTGGSHPARVTCQVCLQGIVTCVTPRGGAAMSVVTATASARRLPRHQLDTGLAHLRPADREARGKDARTQVPRESHAVFEPPADRPDPVTLLEDQAASRLPDLVPVRYGRMSVSPFAFFRGAALVMASDLAGTPVSGLPVQACGDAHLSNFGIFGSAERRLVFDVNDFDETLPGPWEWDVKRLAASLEVAARDNGFLAKQRRDIVLAAVAGYRLAMRGFAAMTNMEVWYARTDVEQLRAGLDSQMNVRQRKKFD